MLYSLVFGASTFHSFYLSPIAFKTLPRSEFGALQNKVFPSYFLTQTVSAVLLGLTSPFKLCPFSLGLLTVSGLGGAINLFVLLPICRNIKDEREKLIKEKLHETVVNGEVRPTETKIALDKKFGMYHGLSSLANIFSIASLGVYGLILAKRLL